MIFVTQTSGEYVEKNRHEESQIKMSNFAIFNKSAAFHSNQFSYFVDLHFVWKLYKNIATRK